MKNKKKALNKGQVRLMKTPRWPELAINKLWDDAMLIPGFKDYMPFDWKATSKKVERSYFFGVLGTLMP